MKIVTIIVTYNGMKWIEACLRSLRKSTTPTTVVIVDNMSNDGTADYVRTHFPEVVLFPQQQNLGFGQANNVGLRYAINEHADYVLLLNQDAYLQADALEYLIKYGDGQHIMSPIHMNGTGDDIDFTFINSCQYLGVNVRDVIRNNTPSQVREVCAACWLMPISVIKRVGIFNPLFFQYGEDNNYCQRMYYHGLKHILLIPQARVFHDRKIHGNLDVFNAGKLHKEILLSVIDINTSTKSKVGKVLLLLLHYYHHILTEPYRLGSFAKEILWILTHQLEIRHSIVTEKKEGAWI